MADSTDLQALKKISSEVDESQIKIILSSECIKAQEFLLERIRKQTKTQKEIFKHIRNSNSKLEVEIKNAEEEIKSLLLALNTVKSANVELKKELLLAKESKLETIERVRNGEKKYEALWLQCKGRYENLPYVKKWLETTSKQQTLKEKVDLLTNDSSNVLNEIKFKQANVTKANLERIIELAHYIVREIPHAVQMFKEKSEDISRMKKEIEEYSQMRIRKTVIIEPVQLNPEDVNAKKDKDLRENWPNLYRNISNDALMMPKLQLKNIDFDCLSAKLDQMKRTDTISSPLKRSDDVTHENISVTKKPRFENTTNAYFSSYFKDETNIDKDYSRKKLIHILEDVKLNDKETFNIMSKVNPDKLQQVEKIEAGGDKKTPQKIVGEEITNEKTEETVAKVDNVIQSEVIEEVNMSANSGNVLVNPPTQFLDFSQELSSKSQSQLSQGRSQKIEVLIHRSMNETPLKQSSPKEPDYRKKVSFDIPLSEKEKIDEISEETQNEVDKNDTVGSQLNTSTISDQSFMNIKNMILKEHNLDLSPQFFYAKNNLQKTTDDQSTTSKFFARQSDIEPAKDVEMKIVEVNDKGEDLNDLAEHVRKDDVDMKAHEVAVSSPKVVDRNVKGFLFSHGAGDQPASLDVSFSTAGYDDQDIDYQCIDSSVLLSPKADLSIPIAAENMEEVTSQEVPNFLSGLRKTGLSFFGKMALDSKPGEAQSQGGFNFNFGGSKDDKKSRGGLFNMFR